MRTGVLVSRLVRTGVSGSRLCGVQAVRAVRAGVSGCSCAGRGPHLPAVQARVYVSQLCGPGSLLRSSGRPPAAGAPNGLRSISSEQPEAQPGLHPQLSQTPVAVSPRATLPGPSRAPGPAQWLCATPCGPLPGGPAPVPMTTLEELDGGLGSCPAGEDLSVLAEPCPGRPPEDKAAGSPRLAHSGSWSPVSSWVLGVCCWLVLAHGPRKHQDGRFPQDSREPGAGSGVDARPKKTDKEPAARGAPGPGRDRPRAGTTSRSAPARRKPQAAPPPPPAPSEELPWGAASLNTCLVLAALLALLGSALQLCRDAVVGEATAPAPIPEPWVPPSPPRKEPVAPLVGADPRTPQMSPWQPKPPVLAPPPARPEPPAEAEDRGSLGATDEAEAQPGGAPTEAAEKRAPRVDRGPKDKPRRTRPLKTRPRSEEPREALPRRWETREGGRGPWARDSRDPGRSKRQARASPRRHDREERLPGRQKPRAGKGRD
ncbi:junctional sarcoplasmic reticulum protein 1 [Lepus europaeus]|uniref:junctional sarcoplasmic reticulum protein 1 n=1 Tax=Lepus europaeus TaxID=9983 RepID=UPI002B4A61EF|nr:junctional sarcoplasmic reticulum protein 1 [Lepus europaeus]